MRCRNPYIAPGGGAHGCGQCLPCRINKKREWSHRIMLEATQWSYNSFWTLTYSDEKLPLTPDGLPTLFPKHLTDFLKRLRKDYLPNKLRYFYVGEYGDRSARPHYHIALFNYPGCDRGVTHVNRRGDCCGVCDNIRDLWTFGKVHSGQLEDASAAYIAGYVTKKLTCPNDPKVKEILAGRHPELARMSLKPGIGAMFMPEVASALLSHNLHITRPDVPTLLQVGMRAKPLGRYLTRELRKHVGMEPNAPEATIQAQKEKMRHLSEMAKAIAPKGLYSETLRSVIIEENEGKYQQTLGRSKIWKKRDTL